MHNVECIISEDTVCLGLYGFAGGGILEKVRGFTVSFEFWASREVGFWGEAELLPYRRAEPLCGAPVCSVAYFSEQANLKSEPTGATLSGCPPFAFIF